MTGEDVRVRIDDKEVVGVSRLFVELSTGIEADCYRVRIPNPGREYTKDFTNVDDRRVDIELAGKVCFRGYCDEPRATEIPEPALEIAGRDFTGLLIDEVVSPALAKAVSNVTSSAAVTKIARAFKLTPKVQTTTKVWGEYQAFGAGVSVWSVAADLAGREGFDAYVTAGDGGRGTGDGGGPELVFRKRVVPAEVSRIFWVPALQGGVRREERGGRSGAVRDCMELDFCTAMKLALGLKVKVVGYDPKRNAPIVFMAEAPQRNRPKYKIIEIVDRSLATKALVAERARAELERISKNLVTGHWRGEVDGGLKPGQAIEARFEGQRDYPLNGVYFVTKVRHELTEDGEFTSECEFASKPLAEGKVEEVRREE